MCTSFSCLLDFFLPLRKKRTPNYFFCVFYVQLLLLVLKGYTHHYYTQWAKKWKSSAVNNGYTSSYAIISMAKFGAAPLEFFFSKTLILDFEANNFP